MTGAMVKAEGVRKRYGTNEVLKGIDLEVEKGEVMCMLGPSGSGKSTFLRCINHLENINSGRLSVDGECPAVVGEITAVRRTEIKDVQLARFGLSTLAGRAAATAAGVVVAERCGHRLGK